MIVALSVLVCMVRFFRPSRCWGFRLQIKKPICKSRLVSTSLRETGFLAQEQLSFLCICLRNIYFWFSQTVKYSSYKPLSSGKGTFKTFLSCLPHKSIKTEVQLCLVQGKSDFNVPLISLGFGFLPISSKMAVPFDIPNSKVGEFPVAPRLQQYVVLSVFWIWDIQMGVSWYLIVLIWISLMTWFGVYFHMLICHVYIFFGEVSVKWPIFKLGCLFSYCWVLGIFWITVLSQMCLLQIFYPCLWLLFLFCWYCISQSSSFQF